MAFLRLHELSDVVGHVERAQLVPGLGRLEHPVPHLAAVQVKLVVAESAQMDPGPAHRRGAGELAPQVHTESIDPPVHPLAQELGTLRSMDRPSLPGDPGRGPLGAGHGPGLEVRGLAEGARPALIVPPSHAPPPRRVGAQRRARVANARLARIFTTARVPGVGPPLDEQLGPGRREHPERRGPESPLVARVAPGQERFRFIDADGIHEVLAAEPLGCSKRHAFLHAVSAEKCRIPER